MAYKETLHKSGLSGWAGAVVFALFLNAVLFGLMPGLLTGMFHYKEPAPPPPPRNAIDIFRVKRQEPPLPDRQKPQPEKKDKTPEEKKIAEEIWEQKPVSKPRLPFRINSKLPVGPGIVPTLALEKYTAKKVGAFRLEDLDQPLRILMQTKPRRPLRADRMGIEGWVVIRYVINKQGEVEQVEVVDSEPEGVFEKSVLHTAKLWRFSSPTVDGEPVKVLAEQKIIFNFENDRF